MGKLRHVMLFTAVLVLAAGAVAQQNETQANLADQLRRSRTDLRVSNSAFEGDGAPVLLAALRDAQFVFLGEDHGIRQVAQFADALYTHLQPMGYNTVALEVGPLVAAQLQESLTATSPLEQHRSFLRTYPMTVPFYNTAEEYEFLRHASSLSQQQFRMIGFDQELMGSARFLLEQVGKRKLDSAERSSLQKMLDAERVAADKAKTTHNPMDLYMMTAKDEDLSRLEQQLKSSGVDATPVSNLIASREVYRMFGTNGYRSNVERSLLMRRYFHQGYDGVPGSKVFLKAGGEHAFKGTNPLNNRDLGNHIAEMAEGRGASSVHIIMIAAGGEQLMFTGAGSPMKPVAINVHSTDSQLVTFEPLVEEALKHESWSLFDLRPLRPMLRRVKLQPELEKVILGFDFAVIVPKADPSREIL